MKLEIVSHCWRYSRLLTYQLSSFILHPPSSVSVTMTVFHSPEDEETRAVLEYFSDVTVESVVWNWWAIETPQLMRRAIGRNLAALHTNADWIWFADCDMAFGDGALDSLIASVANSATRLAYPRRILLHKSHDLGDLAIARVRAKKLIDVNPQEFSTHRYRRAIGGVQIVHGEAARQYGYCCRNRWQQPAENWQRCREDVSFRRMMRHQLGVGWLPIQMPNLYRLRHSQAGRNSPDVSL